MMNSLECSDWGLGMRDWEWRRFCRIKALPGRDSHLVCREQIRQGIGQCNH